MGDASPAAVGELLAADGLRGDEEVGRVPPLGRSARTRDVARQLALAGGAPGQLSVILAALRAVQEPAFNALGVLTTTGSAAPALIVNGPAVARLGFNGGLNCLGPCEAANAAVGRALSCVLRNLGGAQPGVADMATMGQPGKYTFCLAENEAASPWAPLHVERGFDPSASVVTVVAAAGTIEVVNSFEEDADELLDSLALVLAAPVAIGRAGKAPTVGGGQPLVLMSPEWAQLCARAGLDKKTVKEELWRRATYPVERLPRRLRAAVVDARREVGLEPEAPLPIADQPGDLLLVVAGGVGVKQTVIPNWAGGSWAVTAAIPSAT